LGPVDEEAREAFLQGAQSVEELIENLRNP
jgi:hypothetical protein